MNNKLIILDGSYFAHKFYHSIRTAQHFQNQTGEVIPETNISLLASLAIRTFLLTIEALIHREIEPTKLVLTFDVSRSKYRHELHLQYKQNRPTTPPDVQTIVLFIQRYVQLRGIPLIVIEDFEADDVIATIVANQKTNYQAIDIFSNDFDLCQLVDKTVHVITTTGGLKKQICFDELTIQNKYKLRPDQIPDYKALCGDSSDNYHGATGIGPKTAALLLNQYQTWPQILANKDNILPLRLRNIIELNQTEINKCYALAKLHLIKNLDQTSLNACQQYKLPMADLQTLILDELKAASTWQTLLTKYYDQESSQAFFPDNQ